NVRSAAGARASFGRPSRAWATHWFVEWAVLGTAVCLPPHGTALSLCWLKATTGVPCPGCGLMRSVSCTAGGMFGDALAYNPFGPIVLAGCMIAAAGWTLPSRTRAALARISAAHRRNAYILVVAAFLLFGFVR